jgi:hypothetical protein
MASRSAFMVEHVLIQNLQQVMEKHTQISDTRRLREQEARSDNNKLTAWIPHADVQQALIQIGEYQYQLHDFTFIIVKTSVTALRAAAGRVPPYIPLTLSRIHSLCCINNSRLRLASTVSELLEESSSSWSGVPLSAL